MSAQKGSAVIKQKGPTKKIDRNQEGFGAPLVATATDSPRTVDENCRKLSKSIISKIRQMGLSPTAFARYLSRYAQENERNTPFII